MSRATTKHSPHTALTSSYAIALSLVAVLFVGAHAFLDRAIEGQRKVASVVNMTDRQVILCQRIAWLAARYTTTGDADAHQQLEAAITEMAVTANNIRAGRIDADTTIAVPGSVSKIYTERNLNDRIRLFVTQARVINFTDVTPGSRSQGRPIDEAMAAITLEADGVLSSALNAVAQEYVRESDEQISRLQFQQRVLLGINLLTLLGVGLFIFRPLTDKVTDYVDNVVETSRRAGAARRAAQQASAAKSAFLSNMSHELRTPMTGIMGICDLLMSSPMPQEQSKMVHMLRQSAQILLTLLNDILDLAKVESGRMSFESIDFDLTALLLEARDLFEGGMSEKGITFTVEGIAQHVEAFRGDPKHIRQILYNLVGNALKFTEAGSINIRCWRETESSGSILLNFAVSDTGIGISEEGLTRLFRKFEQEETSTSRRYGGTGLGLAICKQLSEAMGGRIDVRSTKDVGSTFTFNVRVQLGDANAIVAASGTTPVQAGNKLAGHALNILVAEDNLTTQFILTRMLSMWGQSVVAVTDGKTAVARASQEKFDVILMDMQMPVMDGDEATRQIRAGRGPSARIPIIALTADGIIEHHLRYMEAGCDSVLTKPVSWPDLAHEIRMQIGLEVLHEENPSPVLADLTSSEDTPALNQRMFGDLRSVLPAEAFEEMLRGFLLTVVKYKKQLDEHVSNGDFTQAQRTAHAIKGSCAQVGADEVAGIAAWMEDGATDVNSIARKMSQLAEGIVRLHAAVLKVVPGANPLLAHDTQKA